MTPANQVMSDMDHVCDADEVVMEVNDIDDDDDEEVECDDDEELCTMRKGVSLLPRVGTEVQVQRVKCIVRVPPKRVSCVCAVRGL